MGMEMDPVSVRPGYSSFGHAIGHVVFPGPDEKTRRIRAWFIIAAMKDHHSVRYWTEM
jgi:hypothetical protein